MRGGSRRRNMSPPRSGRSPSPKPAADCDGRHRQAQGGHGVRDHLAQVAGERRGCPSGVTTPSRARNPSRRTEAASRPTRTCTPCSISRAAAATDRSSAPSITKPTRRAVGPTLQAVGGGFGRLAGLGRSRQFDGQRQRFQAEQHGQVPGGGVVDARPAFLQDFLALLLQHFGGDARIELEHGGHQMAERLAVGDQDRAGGDGFVLRRRVPSWSVAAGGGELGAGLEEFEALKLQQPTNRSSRDAVGRRQDGKRALGVGAVRGPAAALRVS